MAELRAHLPDSELDQATDDDRQSMSAPQPAEPNQSLAALPPIPQQSISPRESTVPEQSIHPEQSINPEQSIKPGQLQAAEATVSPAGPLMSEPGPLMSEPEPLSSSVDDLAEDLIDTELAQHERWGAAGTTPEELPGPRVTPQEQPATATSQTRVGEANSAARADYASAQVWSGLKAGGSSGLELAGATLGAEILIKSTPVGQLIPVVGELIGGVVAVNGFLNGSLERDVQAMQATFDGTTDYEQAANFLAGAAGLLDNTVNTLNVIAGVAGVITAGGIVFAIATGGALAPLPIAAAEIAVETGLGTAAMGRGLVALQALVLLFRSLDVYTRQADPRVVEAAGTALKSAASDTGAGLAGLIPNEAKRAAGRLSRSGPTPASETAPGATVPDVPKGPIVIEAHLPPQSYAEQAGPMPESSVVIDGVSQQPYSVPSQPQSQGPQTDVDWSDPRVPQALGLDPVTGGLRRAGDGKLIGGANEGPGQLAFDSRVGYDVAEPKPGPYNGHQGQMKGGVRSKETGRLEGGVWSPEAVFDLTPGRGLGSDGKTAVGYGVRVGPPGAFVDHVFATLGEAQEYAKELAAQGSGRIRSLSALPLDWTPKDDGTRQEGNPVDVIRILEVPVGTPQIRSVVAPIPESAPGSNRIYPGGGAQSELPKNLFPRGATKDAPSPSQVGDAIPITQTVVPDYAPPPSSGEQLRGAFERAQQLDAVAAQSRSASDQAGQVAAAAAAQVADATTAQQGVQSTADLAGTAAEQTARRAATAKAGQASIAQAGDHLDRSADALGAVATLTTLLGGFAGFTGVVLEFSAVLPDGMVGAFQRMNGDSRRFISQLRGVDEAVTTHQAAQPNRTAHGEQVQDRLARAGQDVAGGQDGLRARSEALATVIAQQQTGAAAAGQEQDAAAQQATLAAEQSAHLMAEHDAAQAAMAEWAARHQAARGQAIDEQIEQLEAMGLVVDRRPE